MGLYVECLDCQVVGSQDFLWVEVCRESVPACSVVILSFLHNLLTSGLVSVIELWGQNNCKSLACSLRVIISLKGKSNILTFSPNDPLECRLEPGFRKGNRQGMLKGAIPIVFAFGDWRRAVVKLYRGSGD